MEYKINSNKQDNGLYGTPTSLVFMDKLPPARHEVVYSAIVMGIAERYPNETFKISMSSDKGFMVRLSLSGGIYIKYSDYQLSGDTLVFNQQTKAE